MTPTFAPPTAPPTASDPSTPIPPPFDPWVHRVRREDARPSVLVGALAVAVTADAMVTTRVDGIAGTATMVVGAVALVASRRVRNQYAAALAAVATAFGVLLVMRTSWWVVAPLAVGGAASLWLAASFATGGDAARQRWSDVPRRAARAVGSTFLGVLLLARSARSVVPADARTRDRVAPVLRGLVIAVPLVAVVGSLLTSADAVFASVVQLPVDADVWVTHVVTVLVLLIPAGGLFQEAGAPAWPPAGSTVREGRGATEAVMVLAALVLVLGSFAATQVVVALGGADVVLRTAGLTRAEHARQGFFQLVAVAGIVAVALLAVRANVRAEGRGRRRLVVLGEASVGLTLVVVGAAVQRMRLYEESFGLTGLRLAVFVAAAWITVVFVLIGVAIARPLPARDWLPSAVVASILVVPLVVGLVDPDRLIANRNLDRLARTGQIDAAHLASLSDDAAPVIVARWTELPVTARADFTESYCTRFERRPTDGLAWNASAVAARPLRELVCGA